MHSHMYTLVLVFGGLYLSMFNWMTQGTLLFGENIGHIIHVATQNIVWHHTTWLALHSYRSDSWVISCVLLQLLLTLNCKRMWYNVICVHDNAINIPSIFQKYCWSSTMLRKGTQFKFLPCPTFTQVAMIAASCTLPADPELVSWGGGWSTAFHSDLCWCWSWPLHLAP